MIPNALNYQIILKLKTSIQHQSTYFPDYPSLADYLRPQTNLKMLARAFSLSMPFHWNRGWLGLSLKCNASFLNKHGDSIKDPYWKQRIKTMDPKAQQIVAGLFATDKNHYKVQSKLETYLSFRRAVFDQRRTFESVIQILIALSEIKDKSYNSFVHRIVDFIAAQEDRLVSMKFDDRSFEAITKAIGLRLESSTKRNRRNLYKLCFIKIISNNILPERIDLRTINLITSAVDFNSSLDRHRFTKAFDKVQAIVDNIFQQTITTPTPENVDKVLEFIEPYLRLISYFGFYSNLHALNFEKFWSLVPQFNEPALVVKNIGVYFNCLKGIAFAQGANGQDLRLNIMRSFEAIISSSPETYAQFLNLSPFVKKRFHQKVLEVKLVNWIKMLDFKDVDGEHQVLLAESVSQIPRPIFGQIFADDFRKNRAEYINAYGTLYECFSTAFPNQVPQPTASKNAKASSFIDNEPIIRIKNALDTLGLKYKREVIIGGRQVDFLVDGNIAVEFDGDFHIDSRNICHSQNSLARNATVILSGVKLVVISLPELNMNRDTDRFLELVRRKLALLKEHSGVYIE